MIQHQLVTVVVVYVTPVQNFMLVWGSLRLAPVKHNASDKFTPKIYTCFYTIYPSFCIGRWGIYGGHYSTEWHGTAWHIPEGFKTLFYGTEQQI